MRRVTRGDSPRYGRSAEHTATRRTHGTGGPRHVSSTAGIFDSTEALGEELRNIIHQMEDPKSLPSPKSAPDHRRTDENPIQVHGRPKKYEVEETYVRRRSPLPMVKCDEIDGGYEEDEEDSTIYSTSVRSVTKMRTDVVEVTLKPREHTSKKIYGISRNPLQDSKQSKHVVKPYVISHQLVDKRSPAGVETDASSGTDTNVVYIDAPPHLHRSSDHINNPPPYLYDAPSVKSMDPSELASDYTVVDKENVSPNVLHGDQLSTMALPPSTTTSSTVYQHIKTTQKMPFHDPRDRFPDERSVSLPMEMHQALKYDDSRKAKSKQICQKHSNKYIPACTCNEYSRNVDELYRNSGFDNSLTKQNDMTRRVSQVLDVVLDRFKANSEPVKLPDVDKGYYQVNVVTNPKDDKDSPPRRLIFDLIPPDISPSTPQMAKEIVSCPQGDSPPARSSNRRAQTRRRDRYKYQPLEKTSAKKASPFSKFLGKITSSNHRKEALNKSPYRTKYAVNRVATYTDSEIDPEIQIPQYTKNSPYKKVDIAADTPKATKKGVHKKPSPSRTDVYYFDHGNARYLRTTDNIPKVMTEEMAEATEHHATKFWAEIFGMIHIGFAFVTSFLLQMFRFILYTVFRPLTIGVLQLLSDYCIKPLLAVIFNGLLQPPMIFLYNIATSIRDLCEPLADSLGHFFRNIAIPIKAFRFVDINKT